VVITLSLRTPLTKARKGGFKDTDLDYIVYALLKEVIAKSQIDPALVEDVCLGNVSSTIKPSAQPLNMISCICIHERLRAIANGNAPRYRSTTEKPRTSSALHPSPPESRTPLVPHP
jgi:hypothetical protein